jgi:hypothetical protein
LGGGLLSALAGEAGLLPQPTAQRSGNKLTTQQMHFLIANIEILHVQKVIGKAHAIARSIGHK